MYEQYILVSTTTIKKKGRQIDRHAYNTRYESHNMYTWRTRNINMSPKRTPCGVAVLSLVSVIGTSNLTHDTYMARPGVLCLVTRRVIVKTARAGCQN